MYYLNLIYNTINYLYKHQIFSNEQIENINKYVETTQISNKPKNEMIEILKQNVFSWDEKFDRMVQVYEEVIGRKSA